MCCYLILVQHQAMKCPVIAIDIGSTSCPVMSCYSYWYRFNIRPCMSCYFIHIGSTSYLVMPYSSVISQSWVGLYVIHCLMFVTVIYMYHLQYHVMWEYNVLCAYTFVRSNNWLNKTYTWPLQEYRIPTNISLQILNYHHIFPSCVPKVVYFSLLFFLKLVFHCHNSLAAVPSQFGNR